MGRKPTVGAPVHSEFAQDITAYLQAIQDKASVRSIAAAAPQRKLTWWSTVFNGKNALTTDDIDFIARDMLGISPYEFVREAREYKRTGMRPARSFNVGTHPEDVDFSEAPDESLPQAARRGPAEGKDSE